MPELRVACWNVENLFHPNSGVARGPKTVEELDRKIAETAQVVRDLFGGPMPHLVGFVEVGDSVVFEKLVKAIDPNWIWRWENPGRRDQTGLGIAADPARVKSLDIIAVDRPSIMAKPRAIVAECELNEINPLVFALAHWKSRMQQGGTDEKADRLESGRWLGDLLSTRYSSSHSIIVGGDFNAEPFEAPFLESALRTRRHHTGVLHSQATAAYLYNLGWRFLAEPDLWEAKNAAGYVPIIPTTTHGDGTPVVFDSIMVSKRLLKGGPLKMKEASAAIVADPRVRGTGSKIYPLKWKYDAVSDTHTGLSDHFPIALTLE